VTRRRPLLLVAAAFAAGVAIDLVVRYSPFPGYGAMIGIAGTLLIAVASSGLTRLAGRPEDHYPAETPREVEEDLRSSSPPHAAGPASADRPSTARGGSRG
jgi:hypothetical protein